MGKREKKGTFVVMFVPDSDYQEKGGDFSEVSCFFNEISQLESILQERCEKREIWDVTILGLTKYFSANVLKKISELPVAVSVLYADTYSDLGLIYSRRKQKVEVSLQRVLLRHFLTQADSDETSDNLLNNKDAIFLCAHGDPLCIQLQNSILCSADFKEKGCQRNIENADRCGKSCFRVKRFQRSVSIIPIDTLHVSFCFLDVCGVFSVADGLFSKNNSIMRSFLYNADTICVAPIVIKTSSPQEVYLMDILLSFYRKFSAAVYHLNGIVSAYLGGSPTFVMLGCSHQLVDNFFEKCFSIKLNECISAFPYSRSFNTYGYKTVIHFKVFPNVVIENLVCSVNIKKACVCIEKVSDTEGIVFIRCFESFLKEEITIFIFDKKQIVERLDRFFSFQKNIEVHKYFQGVSITRNHKCKKIVPMLFALLKRSDLDGEKFLLIDIVLNIAEKYICKYMSCVVKDLVKISAQKDTTLILQEDLMLNRSTIASKDTCPYCLRPVYISEHVTQEMISVHSDICMKCGIISTKIVPHHKKDNNALLCDNTIKAGTTTTLSLEKERTPPLTPHYVLLGTGIHSDGKIKIPQQLPSGWYNIRAIIADYYGDIQILNKPIHIIT